MKTKVFVLFFSLLIVVTLFGKQPLLTVYPHKEPFDPDSGGPDDYGYIWIDSNDPGGPTYNWIDITGIGTKVYGLDDDNNVGPFPIGFEFPYYWYKVDSFWVNSNGAISFSDPAVYMPYSSSGFIIPSTDPPNDLIIPLGADLTLQRDPDSGECFIYSNNIDTLIVSYLNVPGWTMAGPVGSHTFQLILTRPDSCIYFQYGKQEGNFYENGDCAGIENVSGEIGLQALYYEIPDSGYAVKFMPPFTPIIDVNITDAITLGSKGVFLLPNEAFTLWTTVRNDGNVDAFYYWVTCAVMDTGSSTLHYTDTITAHGLAPDAETTFYFSPDWIPTEANDYYALIWAHEMCEKSPKFDNEVVELEVVAIPGWLMYDSDPSSAQGVHWSQAESGWAQEFVPPCYPMVIDSVKLALQLDTDCDVPILFMDDDGVNGSPGTIIYSDTVFVPVTGVFSWYTVSIPSSVNTITSGAFYVGFIQAGDSFPDMMLEYIDPFSRRGWELLGSWEPYRDRDNAELLIRAYTSTAGISEEEDQTDRSYSLEFMPISPNPVKGNTLIHYSLPNNADVTLRVYNILGQEVRTLVDSHQKPGLHSVIFDTKDTRCNTLPQGVYFCRLNAGNNSLTKKITLIR